MPMKCLLAVLVLLGGTSTAAAQAPLGGYFVAKRACPATPAIRDSGNPGAVRLRVDQAYRLLGENKRGGSHYQIAVPGAEPERRWVAVGCGERVTVVSDVPVVGQEPADTVEQLGDSVDGAGVVAGRAETSGPDYVIAISWQPAFCETRPNKPECMSQTSDRFDASNFSLHGLWPQPRSREYCGVPDEVRQLDDADTWNRLPEPALSEPTREALQRVMPGTQSALDRHEWIRHGTCYGADADEYFADSILVLDAVNASKVRPLFVGAVGRRLTRAEIRKAFDESFGPGAGERVRMSCPRDGDRRIIGELTIGLTGEIKPDADIGGLILAAPPTDGGCNEGLVDAVGSE